MQIRSRLTLQFMLIVAGIMLVAMFYIYFQFKNYLQNDFFSNLRSKANLTAGVAIGKLSGDTFPELYLSERESFLLAYTENISIYDEHNNRAYSFNPTAPYVSPSILADIRQSGECRFTLGKFLALGVTYKSADGKSYVVVSEALFNPVVLYNLARILLIVFCAVMGLVAAGGWVFAGQALAPVSRIMNQMDAILPSNLSQRLTTANQHDELSRLVITFNRLLDRIQQAFDNQKLFLSNISHELKNPLTVIISQLEIILNKERSPNEYRQTLQSVLDDMKELNEVSNKLMQLARINADGESIAFGQIRIDEMIWQVKAALIKAHPEYRVSFEVVNLPEDEEKLLVNANEPLLKTALYNLMDNGCKFSPDKNIKVRLAFNQDKQLSVEIQDKGPGIPPGDLPLVFEPFYRGAQTMSVRGSGIGLSLVNSIVKLHKIKLQVENQRPNGAVFRLEFPPGLPQMN